MRKNKDISNKARENFSGIEKFTNTYLVETLTIVAIVMAAFSVWMHFFIGTVGWAILFLAIGAILGIFVPVQMDAMMLRIHSLSRGRGRSGIIVGEVVKILIAMLIPFVYFWYMGVMAGTAFQYYLHTTSHHSK